MYSDEAYFLTKIKKAELDKLTAVDETEETTPEQKLQSAIEAADSLINSYVGNITDVPLDDEDVPAVIRQMSYDIAVYHLHDNIQYNDVPERIQDKYDAAIAYLKDISAGRASLPTLDEEVIDSTIQYTVNVPVMSRTM